MVADVHEFGKNFLGGNHNYKFLSLSKTLGEVYNKENGRGKYKKLTRKERQKIGDDFRLTHGNEFLARELYKEKIENKNSKHVVVDSIRNLKELEFLQNLKDSEFI